MSASSMARESLGKMKMRLFGSTAQHTPRKGKARPQEHYSALAARNRPHFWSPPSQRTTLPSQPLMMYS